MACRISELVIDAADPDRLAAFWSQAVGYVELGREADGSIQIGPPDAGFGGPQQLRHAGSARAAQGAAASACLTTCVRLGGMGHLPVFIGASDRRSP